MDVHDRIESLLHSTRWVRSAAVAHALVPELASGAPPLVDAGEQRTDGQPVLPVLGAGALVGPLSDLLAETAGALTSGGAPTPVQSLSEEALARDPLVVALADLLQRSAVPGLDAIATPALTLAWASSRLIAGEDCGVVRVDPGRARALADFATWRSRRSPAEQGAALSTVAWELSGRVAAAFQLATQGCPAVRDNPLIRRLVHDPLVLSQPRSAWAGSVDYAVLGGTLGLEVETGPLAWAAVAIDAALSASEARRSKGKAGGMDAAVADAVREVGERAQVAWHPTHAAIVLAGLPELVSAKELKAAGIPADPARLMTQRPGALALASAWQEVLRPLLGWDLLSALVDRVTPVARGPGAQLTTRTGPLPGGERWSFLCPRPAPDPDAHVVAVRLTELQSGIDKAWGAPAPGAARAEFDAAARAAGAPIVGHAADHGLAAFRDPVLASRFALSIAGRVAGPRTLTVRGREISLSHEAAATVGVASGAVEGGTDGAGVALSGAAVGAAVALAGVGPQPVRAAHDTLGFRQAGLSEAGLANGGVVGSGPFLAALLARLRKSGGPLHVQGEAGAAGGVSQDFQAYPVVAWWEQGDEVVTALALVDPPGEQPAVDLQMHSREAFAELHAGDAGAASRRVAPAPATTGGADPFGAGHDPFADAAPEAVEEAQTGGMEPVDSVFGFSAPESAPAPDPAPAPAPREFAAEPPLAPDAVEQDRLDDGFLDAFSREGATDEAPVVADFSAPDTDTPMLGTLALLEDDDPEVADEAPTGPLPGPAEGPQVGRLVMFEEEDSVETGPTTTAAPDLPESGAPMVAIEDDWEDEDSWDSEEAEEGVLTEDWDDGVGDPAAADLALQAPAEDDEVDAFAFEPTVADEDDAFTFEAPAGDDGATEPEDAFGFEPTLDDEESGGFAFPEEEPVEEDDSADIAFAFAGDEPDDGGMNFARATPSPLPAPEVDDDATLDFAFAPVEDDEPMLPDPDAEPEPDASPAPAPPAADDDPLLGELVRMFQHYKVVETDGAFTFGIRDGGRIRDAHAFDTAGDAAKAYQQFLQYKIRHGFVTEADKVRDVPASAEVRGIDGQLLRSAYAEVAR